MTKRWAIWALQEVYEACKKAHETGSANWLTCIDYLLASTEYESFMELSYDHYMMSAYDPDEDEEWDAPEEEGEGDEHSALGENAGPHAPTANGIVEQPGDV